MKNISYFLFLAFFSFIFIPNAVAISTKNGIEVKENESANDNTFSLYCSYNGGYYILIDRALTSDNGNIESNTDLIDKANDETLKKYGFMNNDGTLDCPRYVVTDRKTSKVIDFTNNLVNDTSKYHYTLQKDQSLCIGKCLNNQTNIEKSTFNCFYLSQNSDKKITVSREEDNGVVYITFPDGNKEVTSYPITETCQDFYFDTQTKKIKLATYEYLGNINQLQTHDPTMYDFICGLSSSGNKNVEYFCAEGCSYPQNAKIECKEVSQTINKGNINLEEMCNINGVRNTLRFLGYLLLIVKIIIPILLIVLGVVDFYKAMVSSDAESIQKASRMVVTRIIIGVAIFLIPTIVNFVFKGLLRDDSSSFNKCRICVFNPNQCD